MGIRWPKVNASGTVSEAMVSAMDLLGTWLEVEGVPIPTVCSRILVYLFLPGKTIEARDYVDVERYWLGDWDPIPAIIGLRYKLIQRYCADFPVTPSSHWQGSLR